MAENKSNIDKKSPEFPALRISLIYFFISIMWILFSDQILAFLTPNLSAYVTFSTYKGSFFVLISTLLIFYLIKSTARKTKSKQKEYYIEQFKIEEKLSLSNEILQRVNSIVLVSDSKGSIIYASPSVKDILGYTSEEILGRGWWEKVWKDKERIELEIKKISECAKENNQLNIMPYERQIKTKDGKTKWFLWQDAKGPKDYVVGIAHDITELKKAEELQRESEEKYKLLFSHSPVGIFVYDMNLVITDCNDKFSTGLNTTKETLIGLNMSSIRDKSILPCIKVALTGAEGSYEGSYVSTFSSIEVWVQMLTAPLKDSDGNVKGGIGIVNDITGRLKTEESLKTSDERYRAFISQSIEGIYRMEMREPVDISLPVNEQMKEIFKSGVLEECNEAMAEMYGFASAQELTGKSYISFYGNYDDPVNLDMMNRFILAGYKTKNDESREFDKNGKLKIILNNAFGIIEEGKLLRIWGTQTDITELRTKQEQIRKLSYAVDQSPNAIAITNSRRIVEYINNNFINITGFSHSDIIGKDITEIYEQEFIKEKLNQIWESISEGNIWNGDIVTLRKNGKKYCESVTISPIKDEKGNISHYLMIIEDITLRKIAEEELFVAKEKAEEMSRLKSNFLANMSHELRTPLTGILGFSEILYNEIDKQEFKDMAEILLKGSRRLNDTLNSILDLSRIEANKVELRKRLVDFPALILEIHQLFLLSAKEKNIELKTEIDDTETYALLDEYILSQVLSNLINNAIKFTYHGNIIIKTGLIESKSGKKAYIKISDTGIGIEKAKQRIIFEPFRQVSEGLSRSYEGTGLGLTITKKFIELMGGTIELESEPGKGTTFTVIFPATEKTNMNAADLLQPKQNKKNNSFNKEDKMYNVLIIEDDEVNKKMVKVFLRDKFLTEEVSDEESALNLTGSKQFDIILLDINLKGKDGIETLKKIRLIPGYKNTPVVAITAYAMVGDREKFLEMGCDYYISKPYTRDQLLDTLSVIIQKFEN